MTHHYSLMVSITMFFTWIQNFSTLPIRENQLWGSVLGRPRVRRWCCWGVRRSEHCEQVWMEDSSLEYWWSLEQVLMTANQGEFYSATIWIGPEINCWRHTVRYWTASGMEQRLHTGLSNIWHVIHTHHLAVSHPMGPWFKNELSFPLWFLYLPLPPSSSDCHCHDLNV